MLNKNNFKIAKLCPEPDEHMRYPLHGIRVTPTGTTVTDGHMLLHVGGVKESENFDPFILSAKVAQRVAAALPARSEIPDQEVADIEHVEGEPGGASVRIGVTKPGFDQSYSTRAIDGEFPDAEKVVPATAKATMALSLDLDILIPLLEQIRKFYGNQDPEGRTIQRLATFRFYEANKGARIDAENHDLGQKLTAVIMPCRT